MKSDSHIISILLLEKPSKLFTLLFMLFTPLVNNKYEMCDATFFFSMKVFLIISTLNTCFYISIFVFIETTLILLPYISERHDKVLTQV